MQGFLGACDGKECQSGGIEEHHRTPQAAHDPEEPEYGKAGQHGGQDVTRVSQGVRRQGPNEDVAGNAAEVAGYEREHQNAEQVEPALCPCRSATQRENERTKEICNKVDDACTHEYILSACRPAAAAMEGYREPMTELKARKDVEQEHTWNLESIFADMDQYRRELEATDQNVSRLAAAAGTLDSDGLGLYAFLEDLHATVSAIRRLGLYANLPVAVDGVDQAARATAGEFSSRVARWNRSLAFIDPELLAIGHVRLAKLRTEEPRLERYDRAFSKLEEQRQHILSAETEALLSGLSDPFAGVGRAQGSLVNGELQFEPVTLPDGTVAELAAGTLKDLVGHPDRSVREQAFRNHTDGFLGVRNTLAELYLTRVRQEVYTARARTYPDTVEAALKPKEVPRATLDAVLRVFGRRVSVWHRYWEVRRRLLGVERLEPWDVFAPLTREPLHVPYEQSVAWILDAVKPLGEDYVARLEEGLRRGRWVDIYPNRGKRDGAFAAGAPGTQPFIMMSYDDGTAGLSTLAHELGHAMHGQYTYEEQPPVYAGYSMVVAETASNLIQALLFPQLLDRAGDRDFRIAIIEEALYNLHRYFFIMPILAQFELRVHDAVGAGEGLTAQRLGSIMQELFQLGYGDAIETDERTGITWATFGHLFIPFYTFQYSCGISAAAALAADLRSAKPGATEAVLGFLSAGSHLTPIETLRRAGVDLTDDAPFERAFDAIEEYLDRLEQLLGQD